MKKFTLMAMLLSLLLTALPFGTCATETDPATEPETLERQPYQCGEDLWWRYEDGTLVISGTGDMDDYEDGAPWLEYKDSIREVVFTGDVTSVGACAFTDYDSLKTVAFGDAMHTIGYRAFKSCDGLMEISLPSTFRKFGEECFMGCKTLTTIWCYGSMPSFKGNCLWDVYATLYYPANNLWPVDPVMQLQNAFQHRVLIVMGSTMDYDRAPVLEKTVAQAIPQEPVVTEPAVTEPAPTEPPTTQPGETLPQTIPTEMTQPTNAPTVPETTEQTQPETEPQAEELLPFLETEPQQQPARKSRMNGIRVGIFLIAGVLVLMILGALVFRGGRR